MMAFGGFYLGLAGLVFWEKQLPLLLELLGGPMRRLREALGV